MTLTIGQTEYLVNTLQEDYFIKNAYDRSSMWDAFEEIDQDTKKIIYNHYNEKNYPALNKIFLKLGVKRNLLAKK